LADDSRLLITHGIQLCVRRDGRDAASRGPSALANKLAFYDADTDTDILADDPREKVGVGVVECEL